MVRRCCGAPRRRERVVASIAVALAAVALAAVVPAGAAGATTGTVVAINTPLISSYWNRVSVGVTVTAISGPNPTTGTVEISDSASFDDFACTLSLSGTNQVSCSGTYSAVGTDTIVAVYEGAGSYGPSSNSVQVGIAQASTTLSVNATAATVGETTMVTVMATPGLGGNSSGTLSITDADGALDCSTVLSGNEAVCTSSDLTRAGDDLVRASWTGNADYVAASASTMLDVGQATTVVASVTAPASQVGSAAIITVQVEPYPDGGMVSLADADGQVTGCGASPVSPVSGQAVCTTGTLTSADPADALTAQYLGDANYSSSALTGGSLEIDRGTTHLSLSTDPAPTVGTTATYLATLSPSAAGAQGGTVAFSDSPSLGKISDCADQPIDTATDQASCTSLAYAATGTDSVSAVFGGTTNWASSSAQLGVSVAPGTPTVSVSLSPAQPVVGQTVTITATISPSDGGGSVDFSGSGAGPSLSGCSSVAVSGNSARCTSGVLAGTGSWAIVTAYSGDANYDAALGGLTVMIDAAPTTVVLSSSPSNPQAFGAVTLTATVSPVPDGGTVSFSGPPGQLAGCGSLPVSTTTGQVTCSVARLPGAGTLGYSATYLGDSDYQPNSGDLQLLIGKVPTSVLVTASPNPVPALEPATLTVAVSPVPDGGTVTVTDSFGDLSCANRTVPTSGATPGVVTCTTSALSPTGTDSLSASYSGTPNYTSASGTGSITVQPIVSNTAITSADPVGVVGQQLHVSVRVSPPPSNGTVSFLDSLGELSSCATVGVDPMTGDASCVSGILTVSGDDSITARFLQTPTEGPSSTTTAIPIEEAPSFGSPLDATAIVGTPASVQLPVSGYPAPEVSATTSIPAGLQLGMDGEITGTAAAGSGGSYAIPVDAVNALSNASATLDLVVDQAPSVSSVTDLSAPYGVESTFPVMAAAGTYPVASFTLSGALPQG